ncbi:MAG: hypothetical protein H6685_00465 [Deltaproteobacteria bacterium]|nr:hypothetical protein [Deltaproteobacteria bacterium]
MTAMETCAFVISEDAEISVGQPSVGMNEEGETVVVWDYYYGGGSSKLARRRISAFGSVAGTEDYLAPSEWKYNRHSSVAMDPDGNVGIAWNGEQGSERDAVLARIEYPEGGAWNAGEISAHTLSDWEDHNPSIGANSDGNYFVVWFGYREGIGSASADVFGRTIDGGGDFIDDTFPIPTTDTGQQYNPDISIGSGDDVVVVWQSDSDQDGWGKGVFAQRFDEDFLPVDSEFQINSYTDADQDEPSVAVGPNGNFVVAWQSAGQDGDSGSVVARQFLANGTPVGSDFVATQTTAGSQEHPSVASFDDNAFAITWRYNSDVYTRLFDSSGVAVTDDIRLNGERDGNDISVAQGNDTVFIVWNSDTIEGDNIVGTRLDDAGNILGNEFPVNSETNTDQSLPDVACDTSGNCVVTWNSGGGQDGDASGIIANLYDSLGRRIGEEFIVNTTTDGSQQFPSVATDDDGDFVIVWVNGSAADEERFITGQRFNAGGSDAGVEFTASQNPTKKPSFTDVAMDATGNYVVAWHEWFGACCEDGDIYIRRYNASGTPQGGQVLVNTTTINSQDSPSIGMNSDGEFVVVWESDSQDGSGSGVYAQRFSNSGATVGSEFLVNVTTAGDQLRPSAALSDDDNLIVTWESEDDGGGFGVYGRIFDSSNDPVTSEFLVNESTISDQSQIDVTVDANGNIIVTWSSNGGDGDDYAIFARRFDSTGSPIDGEFLVNSYTSEGQERPSIAVTPEGRFFIAWQSYLQDGDGYGIYAKRFNANGVSMCGELYE